MGTFLEYASEYRDLAEQCMAMAAAAWHVEAKTAWLDLARKWQRLGEEAEMRAAQAQPVVKLENLN
jgi:hypothetical protein